ncbi:MAG: phosphate propanoyltransferase [Eubacteriaceae bacterium]|jgi:putative phosphotransacetylase
MIRRVPLGLSNKHIHLSQEDLDYLYGEGYELTPIKNLVQPGQFASQEKVTIIGPKGKLENIRILGPVRKETQLEVNICDGYTLGIRQVPIRLSGHLEGTPGFIIEGPDGKRLVKDKGMIVAERHIHLSAAEGARFNIKDKDIVSVRLKGPRGLVFNNVLCRVGDGNAAEMHIDVEEGNAAGARNNQLACIIDPLTFTKDDVLIHDSGEPTIMVGDLPELEIQDEDQNEAV